MIHDHDLSRLCAMSHVDRGKAFVLTKMRSLVRGAAQKTWHAAEQAMAEVANRVIGAHPDRVAPSTLPISQRRRKKTIRTRRMLTANRAQPLTPL